MILYKLMIKSVSRRPTNYFRGAQQSANNETSMIEILNLKTNKKVNRKPDTFEIVFVLFGRLRLGRQRCEDISVPRKRLFLLSPGGYVSYTAEEECSIVICRLDSEVRYSSFIDILSMRQHTSPKEFDIHVLACRLPVTKFAENLAACVESGLRYRAYLLAKYTELMFLLQEYYTKKELALLLRPMLGKDMEFRCFVYRNVGKCQSVKEMADMYCISEGAFRRKFLKEMGVTPLDFIIQNKQALILHELEYTNKSIKEIGGDLGFKDQSHLTHFCRKHMGETPSKIRKLRNIQFSCP